ncbi:MAG: outer membrane-stress sensor serine endopeptidase DegS, partial [Shewanella sp.]
MTIKDTLLYVGKATLFGLIMAMMFLLVTHLLDNGSNGSLLQKRGNHTVEL